MPEPIIELAKALKTELDAELAPLVFERRYAPYFDRELLDDAKWLIVTASEETSNERRTLVDGELAVDVALEIAVPARDDRDDEPLDAAWCDARLEELGALKDLYRPGGTLRDKRLADCDFRRYTHAPLYRPELLLENGIFVGVVRLIYYHEFNAES